MILFNKRLLRYPGIRCWSLRYWGWVLAIAIGGSSVGCWQEIRYQPEETTPASEQVVDTELVSEALRADQNLPSDHPSEEDSHSTTQVVDSPPAPSPPPLVTVADVENLQTPTTPTANPQTSEKSNANETRGADLGPTRAAYAAWRLGSQWSMGAAIYAKGQPVERYQSFIEHAESAAHLFDIDFTPLPYKVINSDPVATIVTYLLDDQGFRLAEVLDRQHGVRHAALLELAIRSNLLLLIYSPHNMAEGKGLLSKEQFQIWVDRLTELVGSSQLSDSIGKPLLDQLHSLAPYADVKQAVFELHKQVAAELRPED